MRVALYEDDKGRWHWKIFKKIGQEGQVETNGLVEECRSFADMETRCPGFNDSKAAKNEGFGYMKILGG